MKYWRGYLVAGIFAAIAWALTEFAKAHRVLVDMIYPYMSRLLVSTLAEWSSAVSFGLWQAILVALIAAGLVSVVLMIVLRWNPVQWFGWILAAVACVSMLNTLVYGLNAYAGPLANDMRLEVLDYTVSELNEAALYFRDQANELAGSVRRDSEGYVNGGSFEEMAEQAGDGFRKLTYEEAISVFAGSTAPVKKMGLGGGSGKAGTMQPLTGEAMVDPDVPSGAMMFSMCVQMARRLSIYSDADAAFAAFMACTNNSSPEFQYSGYLMAYQYCYNALKSVPTSTAQACAANTNEGVNSLLRKDLEASQKYFGTEEVVSNVNTAAKTIEGDRGQGVEESLVQFAEYSHVTDLLASWYVQKYILPLHVEEEKPFDPFDANQVDLSGIVNAPAKG